MTKKWKITGFLDVNINVDEVVEAENEEEASDLACCQLLRRLGIGDSDVNNMETYADEIE